ncbi:MAG: hypothetical protein K9N51_10125 [Candidatus Pacebacteria bacterium]|nr:hypothetical protein [Candidatus Paceibacterota bacterium]
MHDELLKAARDHDMAALAELDRNGLLAGVGESLDDYLSRIHELRTRIATMEHALDETGHFDIEGIELKADQRIPQDRFEEIRDMTAAPYSFVAEWVPGFYIDPSFGWLFGGCAYYFYPEFFALFIIRKAFARQQKWLIYDRRELLAHELCHVARVALHSKVFEEHFAYQVSNSRFRRNFGGVFVSAADSFMVLGSTLLLLLAQFVQSFLLPALWVWPFWLLVIGVVIFLLTRYRATRKMLRRAARKLRPLAGTNTEAVLFRCTDAEIVELGTLENIRNWLDEPSRDTVRWQVIKARFLPPQESESVQTEDPLPAHE